MERVYSKLIDYVAYSHLWHFLDKRSPNDDINYLMLQMVEIEEEILSHFGLPFTLAYSEILQELGIKNDFTFSDITACIENLESEAKEYFNRPVISDIEILRKAQELEIDIDYVLPELTLKLLAEPYYNFCYYFLFIQRKITPELFLEELKSVVKNKRSRMLTNIVNKKLSSYKNDEEYRLLKNLGLKYLDVFLENYHTFDSNRLEYIKKVSHFKNVINL